MLFRSTQCRTGWSVLAVALSVGLALGCDDGPVDRDSGGATDGGGDGTDGGGDVDGGDGTDGGGDVDGGGGDVDGGGIVDAGGGGVPPWVDDYPLSRIVVMNSSSLIYANVGGVMQWFAATNRGNGSVYFPVLETLGVYQVVSSTTLIRTDAFPSSEVGAAAEIDASTSLRSGTFMWNDGFMSYSNGGFSLMSGPIFAEPDTVSVSADIGGSTTTAMVAAPDVIDEATLFPPPGDGLSTVLSLEDGTFDLVVIEARLVDGAGGNGQLLRFLRPDDMTLTGTTRRATLLDAESMAAISGAGMMVVDAGAVGGPGLTIRISRETTGPFGPGGRAVSIQAARQYFIERPNEAFAP